MTVVFFDLDKTLTRFPTATLLVKYYLRQGKIGLPTLFWTVVYSGLYFLDAVDHQAMLRRGLSPFVGRSRREVLVDVHQALDEYIWPSFYRDGLRLLRAHQQRGDRVVLLTSTTWDLAEPIARALGIDYFATTAEVRDDRYVDRLLEPIPYGQGKLTCARQYCAAHDAALADAYFYTDSHSDLPLLEAVGHPRVVNPDIRLFAHAQRMGWPLIRFVATVNREESAALRAAAVSKAR